MNLLVRIWLLACLCFAVYQSLKPEPPRAYAQANDCPGCCYTWTDSYEDCGGEIPCDDAQYRVTAAQHTGAGFDSFRYASVMCDIPGCGSVQNVPTAVNNTYCCDQDNDGYNRPGCGSGTDCNDTPASGYSINPGVTEGDFSNCHDGIDNDCDGQTDSGEFECRNCEAKLGASQFATEFFNCLLLGGATWLDYPDCECSDPSPIVLDTSGNGIALTNRAGGVRFDINADGTRDAIPWIARTSDDSWLALDRNGNGRIDNGAELFGNFAPQPPPPEGVERNGFLALAEFDKPASGGNADGIIDRHDDIFARLRLWRDQNHDGVSQPRELHSLTDLRVKAISLDYKLSRRTDSFGNEFRYRAPVRDTQDANVGRWAWDVFLVAN